MLYNNNNFIVIIYKLIYICVIYLLYAEIRFLKNYENKLFLYCNKYKYLILIPLIIYIC